MSTDFLKEPPKHIISNDVWTDVSIKINVRLFGFYLFSNEHFLFLLEF